MTFVGRRIGGVALTAGLALGGSLTFASAVPAGAAGGIVASISGSQLTFADQTTAAHTLTVDYVASGAYAGKYQVANWGSDPIAPGAGCIAGASANVAYCNVVSTLLVQAGVGNDTVVAGSNLALKPVGLIVAGEDGADQITGSSLGDWLLGGAGNDTIKGGGGADTVQGDAGNDTVSGGDGNDVVRGGAGDDTVNGDNGNDTLYGDAGNDALNGGTGADNMYGDSGTGNVGTGDKVTYADRSASVGIDADNVADDGAVGADGTNPTDSRWGGDNVHDDVDTLEGGSANDYLGARLNVGTTLLGGAGKDGMYGRNGADTLLGQDGDDFLEGGYGNDYLVGGLGNDMSYGEAGNDTIVDGFIYSAEGGNDVIWGDDGFGGWEGAGGPPGKDTIQAFSGQDQVFAQDPAGTPGYGTESIDCGTDTDQVTADPGDTRINCP